MNELVKVKKVNEVLVTSSKNLAKVLGKEHSKVIRSLESILTEPNVASLIIQSSYKDKKGEVRKQYLLTKDGLTLYMFNIQGYNEEKLAYINKFNEMEKQLQNKFPVPTTFNIIRKKSPTSISGAMNCPIVFLRIKLYTRISKYIKIGEKIYRGARTEKRIIVRRWTNETTKSI